jgi:outer membrane biosynthesis protein TonB
VKQTDTDKILAWAQVIFAGLLLLSIIALVFLLVLFKTQLSETGTTILTSVIAALITILTLQMNFFFARSRPAALPDPTTTSTTTTTTTTPTPVVVPEGSKLVPAPPPPAQIVTPTPETPDATKTPPATPPAV